MWIQRLGPDYAVWDRAARIEYLRASRDPVRVRFVITEEEEAQIRASTRDGSPHFRDWEVEVCDRRPDPVARVTKTLYFRWKKADPKTGQPA
jgi:hypothetical protein